MLETEREGEREKEREREREGGGEREGERKRGKRKEKEREGERENHRIKLVCAHEHKVHYVHSTMYCNILLIICLFERGDLLLVLCVQSVG